MRTRNPADGPYYLVWLRGSRRPEPQIWAQDEFHKSEDARAQIVLSSRPLNAQEAVLSLRELAVRYPAPDIL